MNRGTLPIIARLQALQTAARVAPGGMRVIAGISDPNPLAALLCELNETVLGRTLNFESSEGSSLSLEVSGRRVLRVAAANGLAGAEGCLGVEALEDEHKDNLIKLLQAISSPRNELRVASMPMLRDSDGVSIGLPVALLADLLLIDLNPLEGAEAAPVAPPTQPQRMSRGIAAPLPEPEPELEPEPEVEPEQGTAALADTGGLADPEPADLPAPGGPFLGTLARGIGPTLIAWLIVGGEEDGATEGPEEMVSHLQGFLADEAETLGQQLDQIAATPDAPVCVILGASLIDGHSILCARRDAGILLGVIEGNATQTLLRGWAIAAAG